MRILHVHRRLTPVWLHTTVSTSVRKDMRSVNDPLVLIMLIGVRVIAAMGLKNFMCH